MSDEKPKSSPDKEGPKDKPKKEHKLKPIGFTEDGKPLYRNLKATPAPRDHPIYKLGFVVGGKRLSSFEDDPEKETEKK